jgi:hypothetical protein
MHTSQTPLEKGHCHHCRMAKEITSIPQTGQHNKVAAPQK